MTRTVRGLARKPGFAALAIAILAAGIALATLIFTMTDSVLLRGVPFPSADRLVALWERHPIIGRQEVAPPDFHDWQSRTRTLSEVAAHTMQGDATPLWTGHGDPEPLDATLASWNLFPMLGIRPTAGRVFTADDDWAGHDNVVLISHRLFVDRFAGDAGCIGANMTLDGELFQIVGVLPDNAVPRWADVWMPLSRSGPDTPVRRASHNLEVVGRLKPGVSVAQASADVERIAQQLATEFPVTNAPTRAYATTLRSKFAGRLESALPLLQGGAILVLLVCCANVAILFLVRTAERRADLDVRAALGATPARLFAGALAEALVVSVSASVLGLAAARLGLHAFEARIRAVMPFVGDIHLDWRTFLFSIGTCAATAILFGLVLAFEAARRSVYHRGSRATTLRSSPARMMIAAQTALAVVVLVCAGLLAESFRQILSVDPGMETTRLMTARIRLPIDRYGTEDAARKYEQRLFPKLLALPGASGVAATSQQPLRRLAGRFWIDGRPDPASDQFPVAQFRGVTPEFFDVVGLRLRSGRLPYAAGESSAAVWVNEAFEQRFFDRSHATGAAVLLSLFRPPRRRLPIAGVVSNTRDLGLEADPQPTIYFVEPAANSTLLVRVARNRVDGLEAEVRRTVLELEPQAWIAPMQSLSDVYLEGLRARRMALELAGLFAIVAAVLAGLGVHAVVARDVAQRAREVGIRIAVGATGFEISTMFIAMHARAVGVGLTVGIALAAACARLLRNVLFGVGIADPTAYAWAVATLVTVATLAAFIPARRSARADVAAALRAE